MKYQYNLYWTRLWIKLLNIFALILAVGSIVGFLYFVFNKEVDQYIDSNTLSYIVGPVALILIAQIYLNIMIIVCVSNYDDEELIGNRYVIATLSIGLSGILTPSMLLRLPNVDSSSTSKPCFEISKYYARAGLIGGIGGLIAQGIIHWQYQQFQDINFSNFIATIVIGVILLISLINTILFTNKNKEKFETSKFLKAIAVFYLIVASIVLVITLINAILSLLDVISKFLSSNNRSILGIIIMLAYISINILYVMFVWKIVCQTLVGIWSKEQIVEYRVYTKLEDAKEKHYR